MSDDLAPSADVRRHAVRLATDYFVTCAQVLRQATGVDMVTALIFAAISRANIRRLAAQDASSQTYAGMDDFPDDDLREPVSVYTLAKELGLPYETVRRHVRKLLDADLCERTTGGLVIPTRVFAREPFRRGVDETWRHSRRFAAAIGRVSGVPEPVAASGRTQNG